MKNIRSVSSLVAAGTLALAGLGLSGVAQAGDVFWNVGVYSPGVQLGVSNAPPVVYQPVYEQRYQPVYIAPRPIVYVQPAPVYVAPAYYGQPQYVQPQYIQSNWQRPGYGPGWRRGHHHHEHERFEPGRYDGGRSGYDRHDGRRD